MTAQAASYPDVAAATGAMFAGNCRKRCCQMECSFRSGILAVAGVRRQRESLAVKSSFRESFRINPLAIEKAEAGSLRVLYS